MVRIADPGIFSYLPSMAGVGNVFFYIGILFFILLIGAGVIWWAFSITSWKFNVIILEEASDRSTLLTTTKGKIQKRRKKIKFRIMKDKKARPQVPPANMIHISPKGKKSVVLKKIGDSLFDYIPMSLYLRNTEFYVKPFTADRINWVQNELKENDSTFGSFFDKYGTLLMGLGISLIFIAGLVITLKMNQDIANLMNDIFAKLMEFGENICAGGSVPPETPPGT